MDRTTTRPSRRASGRRGPRAARAVRAAVCAVAAVVALMGPGAAATSVQDPPADEPVAAACGPDGWSAEYFVGQADLTGPPDAQECVGAVDEDWGAGGPDGIGVDDFSVRWTTTRTLTAGRYELRARADDGIRVYVDDVLLVDEWRLQAADRLFTVEVELEAGEHTVRVEYYEAGGGALAQVAVTRLMDPITCAAGWRAQYFQGEDPSSGRLLAQECLDRVDKDWGQGGHDGVPVDGFSVRFTTTVSSTGGPHELVARSDDGIRVYVDGVLLVDEWRGQVADRLFTAQVDLAPGDHDVRVDYYEAGGEALVRVDLLPVVELPPPPDGVVATVGEAGVAVTWDAPSVEDLLAYRVYRSETSPVDVSGAAVSGDLPPTSTSFTDTTAVPGTTYRYVVVAVGSAGQGLSAEEIEVVVPVTPVDPPTGPPVDAPPVDAPPVDAPPVDAPPVDAPPVAPPLTTVTPGAGAPEPRPVLGRAVPPGAQDAVGRRGAAGAVAAPARPALARTGSWVAGTALLGAGLVTLGGVLVLLGRDARRRG